MAGPGTAQQTSGFADVFGGHQFNSVDYSGVASYATGGETLSPSIFGFFNTIEAIWATADQSGTYIGVLVPTNGGITAWKIVWYTISGMTQVAPTTNLSAKTLRLSAIGY